MSIAAYRKHVEMRIEATNYALRHIPEDRIRYHTCWGSWHTPHTTDLPFRHVIDLMLKVKAQAYSVEALVGFQGRGCADVVQPNCCHPFLLEALLFSMA